MRRAVPVLMVASIWIGPATADETWRCEGETYTIGARFISRDEPPLYYRVVENNTVSVVGILPYVPTDFMGVFLLRKSDGALLKVGAGLPDKGSKKSGTPASSEVTHCKKE